MSTQNIDYRHPAYREFLPEWELVGDCVDGERKIKKRGKKYLPHPSSDHINDDPQDIRYKAYKQRAPFINATGRTLSGLLGLAFNKPVKIALTGRIADIEDDADGDGQPLTQIARDALSQNLQRGRAGILTDYTASGNQTLSKLGRPILRLFTAKEIINWRVTAGKTSLVVVHYVEPVDDPNNFELLLQKVWIELRLIDDKAYSRRWQQSTTGMMEGQLIELKDSTGLQLTELPWSWIGASNNDHTPDAPPLADIANVNIKHYQAEADIAEISHLTGQPTIAVGGLNQPWADKYLDGGIKIGSTKGILLPDNGVISIVQAEDRNLPITVAERREKQMAMLGAKLVERNTSARTATQASDEAQTDNSILSLCVGNVEQAINRALEFAVLFAGSGEGSIEINKRFEISSLDSAALSVLMAMVQSGQMLLVDFIRYQQSIGLIDQSVAPEEVEDLIRNQQPSLTGGENENSQRQDA